MADERESIEAELLARMRETLPSAIAILREIANGPLDSETRRDARKTLERYGIPLEVNDEES